MIKINRILAVCNDYEKCEELLKKTAEISKEHKAGVTLMFVREEAMFELPFFSKDDVRDHDGLRADLSKKAKEAGVDDPAVLVYENDTADRVALEVKRENDTLVVMPYEETVTPSVVRKSRTPVLVLKGGFIGYSKAVLALDHSNAKICFDFTVTLFPGIETELFQDFLYFPVVPTVDPVIEPFDMVNDGVDFTQLLKIRKEAFYEFCKKAGVKGTFMVGENGIDEDTISFAKEKTADLLVICASDRSTMLAGATEDILAKSECDVMVCFEE